MIKKFLLIMIIFLVGCNDTIVEEETIAVNNIGVNTPREIYNLYVKEEYTLQRYEPESGIYNGVYLEQNDGDFIKEFEGYTCTTQEVYMRSIKLGDSFPLSWVLNSYSNLKMPFIIIYPPDDTRYIFSKDLIRDMSKEFGNLQIPIFVNIYPLTNKFLDKQVDYVTFLRDAKTYFELYAPNVSLVWCIDQDLVYTSDNFYPGDDYADWVGIDIYEDIDTKKQLNLMFKELDFFYQKYSSTKPIFLNLAISHFGNSSYSYNIDSKINEINRFFKDIPYKYPRIKMLNYINYDTFKTDRVNKQNYLITDNKKILETYISACNEEIFLNEFIFSNIQKETLQDIRTNIVVYSIDNRFFIERDRIFEDEILCKKITNVDDSVLEILNIDGKDYYLLDDILNLNDLKKEVDYKNKKVVVL